MHRILFTLNLPVIGSLDIYTYGVMMVFGFMVALTWGLKYTKPKDVSPETVLDLSIYILVSGIIGARLLYVLLNIKEYLADPIVILNLRRGGLAWHGAILGAIIGILIFSKKSRISFWKFADLASPCVMVGLAIGRLGCFFNGCCYGKVTDSFMGVVFTAVDNKLRQPTQLYEAALDLIVFFILNIINKRKKFEGETFYYLIILYSGVRFIVEFFREWTSPIPLVQGLNIAQGASILIIIIMIFIGRILSRTNKIEEKANIQNIPEENTEENITEQNPISGQISE